MTSHDKDQEQATSRETIYRYSVSVLLTIVWSAFLWAHVRTQFTVDPYVILLLCGLSGVFLFPCLSRVKIGNLLELEQRAVKEAAQASVSEAKRIVLRGRVVQDQQGRRFYIDNTGGRHLIKHGDDKTAYFLAGAEGIIPVSQEDLTPYQLSYPTEMESVLDGRLLKAGNHIFVLLNGKRYWVGMDDLVDWGRDHVSDWQDVTADALRSYPRGRSARVEAAVPRVPTEE